MSGFLRSRATAFHPGSFCRVKRDGLWYEARLLEAAGTELALVKLLGREKTLTVRLKDLLPSRGEASRRAIVKMATQFWNVGDACLAVYYEDGQTYKAVVSALETDGSQTAVVTFVEYGNEQVTKLADLTRPPENTDPQVIEDTVKEWEPGMFCRVADPEDGLIYEGEIEENPSTNGLLTVGILGCGKKLTAECLKLKSSAGLEARRNQLEKWKKVWNVGDACKVIYAADNRPYLARVTSIRGDSATVKYDEYDAEDEFALTDLQKVSKWNVNDHCMALYSDGNSYKAVVKKVNDDDTVEVVFDGFVDEETVKVADLSQFDPLVNAREPNEVNPDQRTKEELSATNDNVDPVPEETEKVDSGILSSSPKSTVKDVVPNFLSTSGITSPIQKRIQGGVPGRQDQVSGSSLNLSDKLDELDRSRLSERVEKFQASLKSEQIFKILPDESDSGLSAIRLALQELQKETGSQDMFNLSEFLVAPSPKYESTCAEPGPHKDDANSNLNCKFAPIDASKSNPNVFEDRYKFSPSSNEKKIPDKQAVIIGVKNFQEKMKAIDNSLLISKSQEYDQNIQETKYIEEITERNMYLKKEVEDLSLKLERLLKKLYEIEKEKNQFEYELLRLISSSDVSLSDAGDGPLQPAHFRGN